MILNDVGRCHRLDVCNKKDSLTPLPNSCCMRTKCIAIDRKQVNPLARIPLFHECRGVVAAFMDSASLEDLESGIQGLVDEATATGEHTYGRRVYP